MVKDQQKLIVIAIILVTWIAIALITASFENVSEIIKIEDLESKKPGNLGISAKNFSKVVGKKSLTELKKGMFVTLENIETIEDF